MSVFTFETKTSNPVTSQDVIAIGQDFGIKEHDEASLEDYKTLLAVFHDACEEIMAMDDYIPSTDLKRFPRENVHFPENDENKLNAWGYKVTIKDSKGTAEKRLLDGSNVVLKDCIGVANVPMLLGTNFIQDYVPETDATVVTRLLVSGATIVGKAVCENLCHSATSHSAGTGPIHSPLAHGYSTGGSSSGCAALVADPNETIDIAIGADQGGSVRIPAGWCGLVGIKPTFGLIPFTGCASNEATNDHLGILTRDVLTNAKALQAVAGSDNIDDRGFNAITTNYYDELIQLKDSKKLVGFKIAVLKEGFDNPAVETRIKQSCLDAIEKFKDLGATVTEVSVPLHLKGPLIWTGISKVGGYLTKMNCATGRRGYAMNSLNMKFTEAVHDQDRWDEAYPSTKNIYYNGAYALKKFPSIYGKCMNLSRQLKDDYNKILEDFDVIVLPNLPYIANSHATLKPGMLPLELLGRQVGLSSNTAGFDQTGHPALSLPCGMLPIEEGHLANSGTKLPVSLQIVGKWYDEKSVYTVAHAWEQSYDWKTL